MKRTKHIFIILNIVLSLLWGSCGKMPVSQTNFTISNSDSLKASILAKTRNPIGKIVNLDLPNDSGYFLKNTGLELLFSLHLTDTVDDSWYLMDPPDTIGKYYKSSIPGHYVLCILDYGHQADFETHVLLELKTTSQNKFKVIESERYYHGNYPGCWSNYYEGFNKLNDFFIMKTCGTGSAYSSSLLYFFRTVQPQDWDASIESERYVGGDGYGDTGYTDRVLSSKFTVTDSTFKFIFSQEDIKYSKKGNRESTKSRTGIVIFDYSKGKMIPRDSTYIKEFHID